MCGIAHTDNVPSKCINPSWLWQVTIIWRRANTNFVAAIVVLFMPQSVIYVLVQQPAQIATTTFSL